MTAEHRLIQVHVEQGKHLTLMNAAFGSIFDKNSLIVNMVDRHVVQVRATVLLILYRWIDFSPNISVLGL